MSFVRSLFGKRATVVFGIGVHLTVALAIYQKLGDAMYLAFAAAFLVVGIGRIYLMHRFDAQDFSDASHRDIRRWEFRYIVGTSILCLCLGWMSAHSVVISRDAFAELASMAISMAGMISVVGRNYGSKITVNATTALLFGPMAFGLAISGDPYKAVLALMVVPLFLTTRSMANGVRDFLYQTVLSRSEIATIAGRFDAALNNMSHGLVMLDEERRIQVANAKALKLFSLPKGARLTDRKLDVVFRLAERRGTVSRELSNQIKKSIEELSESRRSRSLVKVTDDLYLEFSARRRSDSGGIVLIFENVTARVKADEKINYLARFDSLTGLPNRTHFADLARAELSILPEDALVGLVVLDIDDFKHVNDTLGHGVGDRLLCDVATRLKTIDPHRITASRFGADEYVLLLRNLEDRNAAPRLMSQIFDRLCGIYELQGNNLFVSVSAGLVLSHRVGFSMEELQIKADLALHESKKRDKNTWTIFADSMDEKYRMRQIMKKDLRTAIENRKLSLVYQPMFSADGLAIARCEALSRWEHETLGPVSPGDYIPLAEEMGIVPMITEFMLDVACEDCAKWPGNIGVSVNLSALDLRNSDIIQLVTGALNRSGLDPERLEVEVTESAFVEDAATARKVLNELRLLGVTIAIDDFGTGYSNLSYLNSLPVTKVKIDRSFVRDLNGSHRNFKLLSGIVHLAREMDLAVTVEGVETQEQLDLVCATGHVDLIQGFLFGRPLPKQGIRELAERTVRGAGREAGAAAPLRIATGDF